MNARLSAFVSAVSDLTLGDLDACTEMEVAFLRSIKKCADHKIESLAAKETELAGITAAQERAEREKFTNGHSVGKREFLESLPLTRGLTPLEQEECLQGNTLTAIKLVRERTGQDTIGAKNTVMESGFCISQPEHRN